MGQKGNKNTNHSTETTRPLGSKSRAGGSSQEVKSYKIKEIKCAPWEGEELQPGSLPEAGVELG